MHGIAQLRPPPRASIASLAIRHIDHVTYVAAPTQATQFIARWQALGFREHMRVHTAHYPAQHIALVSGVSADHPWATMTGLSISDDADSPINQFIRRYGEGIQHTAYNIDPHVDMDDLHLELRHRGWNFLTPVLTYRDSGGAHLKQLFIAPTVPYGSFVELVQRLPGPNGKPYDAFDTENIDELYRHYADFSRFLLR